MLAAASQCLLGGFFMDYSKLASDSSVFLTAESLNRRGIINEVLNTKAEALARLQALIPSGTGVSTAASMTLAEIGFEDLLKAGANSWVDLKAQLMTEKDPAKRMETRRAFSSAEYIVGSVHAVAQTGEVVVVSQTGSQVAPYAFSALNVIWVVGAQKIVPSLEDALRRVREYCSPAVEKIGIEKLGRPGMGTIGKILVFENELVYVGRKVRMLLVKETLGI
jgi:hypothetical protein